MSTSVIVHQMSFPEMEKLAMYIAKSGLFGMKTPEQAIVLMAVAQAEGRHPIEAARDYDVIQGRPAKKSEAMMRDFLTGGGKVQWHTLSEATADATFSHPLGGTVRIVWDMKRAADAQLAGKDTWKKFPRAMLRSRTVSEGIRTVWPLATSGMYLPEEAADIEHKGPTLEAKAEVPPVSDGRAAINKEVPIIEAPPSQKRTRKAFLDELESLMRECDSLAEVNRLIALPDTQLAKASFTDTAKARLDTIIASGLAAHAPVTHESDDDREWDAGETMTDSGLRFE